MGYQLTCWKYCDIFLISCLLATALVMMYLLSFIEDEQNAINHLCGLTDENPLFSGTAAIHRLLLLQPQLELDKQF